VFVGLDVEEEEKERQKEEIKKVEKEERGAEGILCTNTSLARWLEQAENIGGDDKKEGKKKESLFWLIRLSEISPPKQCTLLLCEYPADGLFQPLKPVQWDLSPAHIRSGIWPSYCFRIHAALFELAQESTD